MKIISGKAFLSIVKNLKNNKSYSIGSVPLTIPSKKATNEPAALANTATFVVL